MDQEKQLSPEEIQVLTGRFTSFCAALGAAMTKCAVWRLKNGDKKLNALEVMSFAGKFDEEHPIPEEDPSFYRVSVEGAIGICPGVEYLTNWMLPTGQRSLLHENDEMCSPFYNMCITKMIGCLFFILWGCRSWHRTLRCRSGTACRSWGRTWP